MDHLAREIVNIDLVSVEERGVDYSIGISFLWYFDTGNNLKLVRSDCKTHTTNITQTLTSFLNFARA
jgi:hypothetical protein